MSIESIKRGERRGDETRAWWVRIDHTGWGEAPAVTLDCYWDKPLPLPLGAWAATAHGQEATLTIESVNSDGVVIGRFSDESLIGFWDEVTQRITFTVKPPLGASNQFTAVCVFTGNLFRVPFFVEPGRDVTATLAGSLYVTPGPTEITGLSLQATARNHVFGWFAQIQEIV